MVVSAPSAEAPWFQHWLSSSSGFRSFLCSYLQDKDLMPYHQPEFKSWIHSFWPVWFENLYLRLSFYLIPESNLIWPSFSTGSITHWWNPVLNEMWDPTVPKLLKISRQQQQSIKTNVGHFPFLGGSMGPCRVYACEASPGARHCSDYRGILFIDLFIHLFI